MGILTGKFTPETRFSEGDFRRRWHENEDEYKVFLQDLDKVERLRALAQDRTLAQLALQFAFTHPAVTCVIPGAKTVQQLEENIKTGLLPSLTLEEQAKIDEITPKGGGRKIWPA